MQDIENFIVRPVTLGDIPSLHEFANKVGTGFTSLPANRNYIESKVQVSIDSFSGKLPQEQTSYFFVLDYLGELAGTTAVITNPGFKEPFYDFRVDVIATKSELIDKYLEHRVLQLVNDFQHCAELATLFLHPDFRGRDVGKMLSRCRFNFIAANIDKFPETIIAEIRGISSNAGISPFWEGIGRHFFAMDFSVADYNTMVMGKQFISDLMPRHPIYIELLPKFSRAVIGKAHINSRKAMQLLETEGFSYTNCVDIFDAGPLISAITRQIKTVRTSKRLKVGKIKKRNAKGRLMLVGNMQDQYKMCPCRVTYMSNSRVAITEKAARTLDIMTDDDILISFYK